MICAKRCDVFDVCLYYNVFLCLTVCSCASRYIRDNATDLFAVPAYGRRHSPLLRPRTSVADCLPDRTLALSSCPAPPHRCRPLDLQQYLAHTQSCPLHCRVDETLFCTPKDQDISVHLCCSWFTMFNTSPHRAFSHMFLLGALQS